MSTDALRRSILISAASGAALLPGLARAADKPLKVGAALPLTGPLAPEGARQRNGYQIWADTVNAAGGIKAGGDSYRIEMVYVDYQSNTPRAVQSAERLITEDKVHFLFAPFGSGAVKAVSAVTEKYGVPMLAPNAASVQVYDQGFKYLFGVYTPNRTLTEPIADLVRSRHPDIRRLAILARNDLFPTAMADDMQAAARSRGFEIVYSEKYAVGSVDFGAALTKLRGAQPDWVYFVGYTNDLILARRQMSEQGVSGKLLTMVVGAADRNFIKAVGRQADGVTTISYWDVAAGYKSKDVFGSAENFAKMYEAKYGEPPEYSGAASAACGVVLQMAIEKVGSLDRARVRDAIAAMDTMTFYGPVRFGPTGQINSLKPPLLQVQGDKPVVIFPPEYKTGELRLGFR